MGLSQVLLSFTWALRRFALRLGLREWWKVGRFPTENLKKWTGDLILWRGAFIRLKEDLIITWDTLMPIYGVCVRLPLCSSIFSFGVYILWHCSTPWFDSSHILHHPWLRWLDGSCTFNYLTQCHSQIATVINVKCVYCTYFRYLPSITEKSSWCRFEVFFFSKKGQVFLRKVTH